MASCEILGLLCKGSSRFWRSLILIQCSKLLIWSLRPKIQQTKILVTCQRFDVLFLFGLVWQYSSIQKNIVQVGSKSRLLTCSNNITLSLPSYTDSASKRELKFCNGYLSLLYFWELNSLFKTDSIVACCIDEVQWLIIGKWLE